MLNLEYLEHFIVTTKYMNFTVAAEKLFMNQSTLSRQIYALEEECQATLFDRSGRTIVLTAAGKKLQQEGIFLLAHQNQVVNDVKAFANHSSVKIKIYTVPGFFQSLDIICQQMNENYSDVELEVCHLQMEDLTALISRGIADFGIIYEPLFCKDSRFATLPLDTEPFVAICSPKHPFAGKQSVTFDECLQQNILFGIDFLIHVRERNKDCSLPFLPQPYMQPISTETRRYQLTLNKGIILLPRGTANAFCSGFCHIPINDSDLANQILLVYSRERFLNPSCQLFIKEAETYIKNIRH